MAGQARRVDGRGRGRQRGRSGPGPGSGTQTRLRIYPGRTRELTAFACPGPAKSPASLNEY